MNDNELKMTSEVLHTQFNFMVGKVKTILDAAFNEEKQNKAVKDLVSQAIWGQYDHICSFSREGKIGEVGTIAPVIPQGE